MGVSPTAGVVGYIPRDSLRLSRNAQEKRISSIKTTNETLNARLIEGLSFRGRSPQPGDRVAF